MHGGSQSRVISPEKCFHFSNFDPQKFRLRRLPGKHEFISVIYTKEWFEMITRHSNLDVIEQIREPQEFPWTAITHELVDYCQSSNRAKAKLHLAALAHQMLVYALDQSASERVVSLEHSQPHRLQRIPWIKQYLQNHLTTPLSLGSLAAKTGCTPSHLSRTFREYEGVTLSQYFRKIRLEAARRHLSENKLSVTEIALESGYPSLSHFSYVFQQQYRCTPLAYRKRFQ